MYPVKLTHLPPTSACVEMLSRLTLAALCVALLGCCVSFSYGQLGDALSLSLYSDASCQTSYPGFDLSSAVTNGGCLAYDPSVNPYQVDAVSPACSANSSASEYTATASVFYGSSPSGSGGCGSVAHFYAAYDGPSSQTCLPAQIAITNSTGYQNVTYLYATLDCQYTQPSSAASSRSDTLAALGLAALLAAAQLILPGL